MNSSKLLIRLGVATLLVSCGISQAALILNASMPITHRVVIQPIRTQQAAAQGGNLATYFGTSTQDATVKGHIDSIWAQAGIDIEWLTASTYVDSFAYDGHPSDYTTSVRPQEHLGLISSSAGTPPKSANPAVLNMFFVNVVPGFKFTSENSANGLAFVDGNGVTQFVGDNLLGFPRGLEVIASVVAHEIGHNLGLNHLAEGENLLQAGGSEPQGERINGDQIDIIFAPGGSGGRTLLQPIPEPSGVLSLSLSLVVLVGFRRR